LDIPSGQFCLGEVARACGQHNLYYNNNDSSNPMKIEHLFLKPETQASRIFDKIISAVTEGAQRVDI
jgi:hypothetical protein